MRTQAGNMCGKRPVLTLGESEGSLACQRVLCDSTADWSHGRSSSTYIGSSLSSLPLTPRPSPLSLVRGNVFVFPLEEGAALPVSVQSTGKELSGFSVGIITLK